MFTKQEQYKYTLFIFLTVFTYFWNIWVNDIWIPNESFYAEAVREMFESKNFLDIYYNYELRFNKPPLTYWAVALSCAVFGINEFAVRLPIVLFGLGSLFLTYLIAQLLFSNKKIALFSVFIFAFSLQFVPNTRYASPEVPLTFFFLLTLYLFLRWYKEKKLRYLILSYVALGLTVLTKGFPYIIVIGGIIAVFLFIESDFNLKSWWKKFLSLKPWIGLPITIAIGFWWYVYSYLKFGEQFWSVYYGETIGRALSEKKRWSIENLTYYFNILSWAFLPYSLTAYLVVILLAKHIKKLSFLYSWIIVMFLIFTVAKGKLPTYILQAFPALSILIAYYFEKVEIKGLEKYLFYIALIVPVFVISTAISALVYLLNLDYMYYFFAVFPFVYIVRFKDLKLAPFVATVLLFLMFVVSVLPKIEQYRPYDQIGKAVLENFIPKNYTLYIEDRFFYNLPFYTHRKIKAEPLNKLLKEKDLKLALVKKSSLKYFKGYEVLWQGKLFTDKSESQFGRLLKAVILAEKGDFSKFTDYALIVRK